MQREDSHVTEDRDDKGFEDKDPGRPFEPREPFDPSTREFPAVPPPEDDSDDPGEGEVDDEVPEEAEDEAVEEEDEEEELEGKRGRREKAEEGPEVILANEEARLTFLIVDRATDVADVPRIDSAAWDFLGAGKLNVVAVGADGEEHEGRILESHVHRGPTWETDGVTVEAGSWILAIRWADAAGFQTTALPMRAGAVGRLPPIAVKLNGVMA